MATQRYALFVGSCYYPRGGWADFKRSEGLLSEALPDADEEGNEFSWWHIADIETGEIVVKQHTWGASCEMPPVESGWCVVPQTEVRQGGYLVCTIIRADRLAEVQP